MGRGFAWLHTGTHLQFAGRRHLHQHPAKAPGFAGELPGGDCVWSKVDHHRAAAKAGGAAGQEWVWAVFDGVGEVGRGNPLVHLRAVHATQNKLGPTDGQDG